MGGCPPCLLIGSPDMEKEPVPCRSGAGSFFCRSFRYQLCDHPRVERDFAGRFVRGETCRQLVIAGAVFHLIHIEVEPLIIVSVILVLYVNRAVAVEVDDFNRLLISTDLHHALNNVFWFDTIGLGDLTHFWAGDVQGMNGADWSVGMYMFGFFPCMMFGIPGAALAMIQTAKNKKAAIGLVSSAALCAFVCGVTEPFEFAFMFLCLQLYVVYAALYGIFTIITYYVGFRAGFCFSTGATDLLFSSSVGLLCLRT